ncbi:MAG: dNTP triphosphohydrolase [Bacteroides sp.]|nr:dNTP triphosphohydrolase [Bacteroides sp.]
MQWQRLISDKRFGLEDFHEPDRRGSRTDFRRDYDRLVFSSPFRRLQNKTQVFPLPGAIFVHNRLTHSLEVSSVGKSLADSISGELRRRYAGGPEAEPLAHLGDIVSAACLAHDLGNPPFGHSGEKAISTFFSEGAGRSLRDSLAPRQWADLVHFEGNANAFRVLTHQFNGRRPGGFAMTYSMLASIVKYPFESMLATKNKFGFFTTEVADFEKVASELGMLRLSAPGEPVRYARHPLVYIVEAADDICYEVMDIEDAHKLRILTTAEVTDALLSYFDSARRDHMCAVMSRVADPNEKVAYMRSCVVGILVDACARAFIDAEGDILAGRMTGSLLDHIPERERAGFAACNDLSWSKIYCAGDVVDIELAGNRIITFLLDKLIDAVLHPDLNYSRLLLSKVPEQYDVRADSLYGRVQAVLDHVSAMTDVYALDLYRRLNGFSLRLES